MSTKKVLLGTLAGVAFGAVLGLLLAPEKGTYTRKHIAKKSEDLLNGVKDNFDEFLENINEKYGIAREGANDRYYKQAEV